MIRSVIRTAVAATALAIAVCGIAVRAEAQVTAITITSRAPFAGGQAFGTIGPYEDNRRAGDLGRDRSRRSAVNAVITDIHLAPRNATATSSTGRRSPS